MRALTALAAPLHLTEKARTPAGVMRVVLDAYPSGALSVALMPDAPKAASNPVPLLLSVELPDSVELARGEFVAACTDAALARALLRHGLFRSTGRRLAGEPVWSLDGLAMIEFLATFQPPLAASKVSFPAHLFEDKEFDSASQKRLIQTFEADGYTRHSAQGGAVWIIKRHCERQKLPFIVYLLQDQEGVIGVLVAKRSQAAALAENEARAGHMVQMVYESPTHL